MIKKFLKYLQKNHDSLYKFMKKTYGATIGLWYFKELYVKHIGFYNGEKRLKMINKYEGYDILSEKIRSGKPFMVGRFGSSEIRGIFRNEFDILCYYAGFFPKDRNLLDKFKKTYLNAAKYLDMLAIWNYKNHFINKIKLLKTLNNIEYIIIPDVLGIGVKPWQKELKNKKILVIHPFKKTIEHQYKKINKLKTLPKLKSLRVIKAIQTLGDNEDNRFETWFDALDYMKKEIDKSDFDIAIIACGAYGLPLAAYVKSIGKQAIHLGGCTQLLFGIKGGRWDNDEDIQYNKHWINPLKEDFLKDYKSFEGGCYW